MCVQAGDNGRCGPSCAPPAGRRLRLPGARPTTSLQCAFPATGAVYRSVIIQPLLPCRSAPWHELQHGCNAHMRCQNAASPCAPGHTRPASKGEEHLQRSQAEAQGDHDAQEEYHDDAIPRDCGPAAVVAAGVSPRGRHAAGSGPERAVGVARRPLWQGRRVQRPGGAAQRAISLPCVCTCAAPVPSGY